MQNLGTHRVMGVPETLTTGTQGMLAHESFIATNNIGQVANVNSNLLCANYGNGGITGYHP